VGSRAIVTDGAAPVRQTQQAQMMSAAHAEVLDVMALCVCVCVCVCVCAALDLWAVTAVKAMPASMFSAAHDEGGR